MNRRTMLQSLAGCLYFPFLFSKKNQPKINPNNLAEIQIPKIKTFEMIGKIKEIKFVTQYSYENMYYQGVVGIYPIDFPTETIINIIGEHGELEYRGFNLKLEDMEEMHRNPEYIINSIEEYQEEPNYTEIIKYKNFEIRLASISLYNKIEE